MADTRDLVVRVIGDDRSVQQMFTRTERRTKQVQGRMDSLNQTSRGFLSGFGGKSSLLFGSGAFIGSAAITAGIKRSVDAASDLNEQISKSRQVFGDASLSIEKWAETTASAMGISQREAIAATGTFGNLFRVIDLAPKQSAEMSRALVQLAADLASFNNASPEDVLVAIRSGLIGEAEPLRRYGVLLSEARVQQIALANTGKQSVKALTDQEKALARYEIILSDTASAQGDFERTSGGLANQSRTLKANLDDLSASIGGALTPALTNLARLANLSADSLKRLSEVDVPGGSDIGNLFGWVSGWKELEYLLDKIEGEHKNVADELAQQLAPALRKTKVDAAGYAISLADAADRSRDLAGASDFLASAMADAASRFHAATEQIETDTESLQRKFTTSIKGLGLKLEKAELTPGLEDDLAVLREVERRVERQIRQEGRTFKLEQELVRVRQQIQDKKRQIADEEERRSRENAAIERDAKRREEEARRRQRERERQAAKARQERVVSRQFLELGLTAEGQPRGPSVKNLRQRLGTLRNQIEGTFLDTQKTDAQLDRIAKVLSGKFGKVGRDVRSAILQMLNDISSALKSGGKAISSGTGEITRGGIRSTENLIKGLGLTQAQEDAIRRRNMRVTRRGSRIGAFGFAFDGGTGAGAGRIDTRRGGGRGGDGAIIINGPITVVADDPESFMRQLQKKSSRTAGSRRGRHGGIRLGLG